MDKKYTFDRNAGRVVISGLEVGYGHTIGNALRRTILSKMPGAAATSVKIDGVTHEFQNVPGIVENMLVLQNNLRQVRFLADSDGPHTVYLRAKTTGTVTAGDLILTANVSVMNPEHEICNVVELPFEATITVDTGVGYVQASEIIPDDLLAIRLDANFNPISNCVYRVEEDVIGGRPYDKLVVDVVSDGSMDIEKAIALSGRLLVNAFAEIADIEVGIAETAQREIDERTQMQALRSHPIDEASLSVRTFNALHRHGIKSIEDLSGMTRREVANIRNLGQISLEEIDNKMAELKISYKQE